MIYGLAGILALAVLALAWRVWKYRRQIDHLLSQTDLLAQEDTNYRLSSCCRVGKTEALVSEINRTVQLHRNNEAALRRENRSYRESIVSISHDIRTPLTSAKGYIQMLLGEKEPEADRGRAYLANIERRIDDVTDMLTQLFEYARIEADEIAVEKERINLTNLLEDTLSMFYEDFAAAGFEPKILGCDAPCYVLADEHGVKRILENLIRNALVHGAGGYVFSLKKEGEMAELAVSNQTDSIEDEDMERIFDRFYTTDRSRSRRTTGLGLAIVKRFAQKMGGDACAELKEGIFTVRVLLPAG
ncbi:MAG: HAMP domain-containing histidine kinase [Bacteroidales bacterium]|nr:HAMP domain-containing histidine kinase [Bacteroidales bacterium]MCM1416512.1 HAMP domain-containing histidine kinase [bacterium]MCM1424490.1 HAMP domain-containing histidine kinase [bacterium]